MARDRGLEELVREQLGPLPGLSEKPMFGGLAWLLDGHLIAAAREDGVLVRLGKGRDGWAIALSGIRPMMSGTRPMAGWVRVDPEGFGDATLACRLIGEALAFVQALPPK